MRWIGLLAAVSPLSGGSSPASTEIVRWSPLTAAGVVKAPLKVHDVGTDTYTTAGDRVLCTGDPWTRSITRIRSPGLLLYPGVTYLDDP
jgi:hypothetical protein